MIKLNTNNDLDIAVWRNLEKNVRKNVMKNVQKNVRDNIWENVSYNVQDVWDIVWLDLKNHIKLK